MWSFPLVQFQLTSRINRRHQDRVREELLSPLGTPAIYGYRFTDWDPDRKEYFILIDRRNGASIERAIEDYSEEELQSCAQSLACVRDQIIEELTDRGHLLGDDWTL